MKLLTPDLVYHDIQPIYSCDFQPKSDDFIRMATSGLDTTVRLWKVKLNIPSQKSSSSIDLVANLTRHDKAVNAVRWSPSGKILASASGDGVIMLWQKVEGKYEQNNDVEDGEANLEIWTPKCLRRHIEDVYDLCWSTDDRHLISGSIDCSAILWDIINGKSLLLKDHKQFVQGVAWDPLNNFVVTQSADRTFRVYRSTSHNCIYKVWKAGEVKLFQDGSWKFFFRRLQFSPDGKLLITPAGTYNSQKENIKVNDFLSMTSSNDEHCAHIFVRNNLSKVAITIPTGKNPVLGVRFNPVKFSLRKSSQQAVFKLPYRWVFCLVLDTAIMIFDTEQSLPIVKVSNIHCLSINDASWSPDGLCLAVCSTDGYCSFIHFEKGELGEPFVLVGCQTTFKPTTIEQTGGCRPQIEVVRPMVDPAAESTEILPSMEVDDEECSSGTEGCSEDHEAVDMQADVPVVTAADVPVVTASDAVVKRRLTLMTVPREPEEPKDKRRRLTLTTLQ